MSPSRPLRAELIEAVARRMFEAAHPDGKWMRSGSGKKRREVWRQRAVPAIDAVLDTLDDRADEWRREVNKTYSAMAGGYFPPGTSVSISGVAVDEWIAVLREGDEQ